MRLIHLFFLAGAILQIFNNQVFALDSLSTYKKPVVVEIGPQEINPLHLLDPLIVQRMQIEEALAKKDQASPSLQKYKQSLELNALLAATERSPEIDLEIALERYRYAGDLNGQVLVFNSYAVYYAQRSEIDKAIDYFNEALKIQERLRNKPAMAKTLMNLAALYKASGKYAQAIALNQQYVQLCGSMNNTAGVATGYLSIAENKILQKDYKAAESYILNKSLYLFRRTGNKYGRMKSFQSLASLYFIEKRYTEAKWFNLQANIMADILGDREAKMENLIKLARVKVAIGEVESAVADFKLAETIATQDQSLISLVKIKADLSEIYHSVGDYDAAGAQLREFSKLTATLLKTANL